MLSLLLPEQCLPLQYCVGPYRGVRFIEDCILSPETIKQLCMYVNLIKEFISQNNVEY